MTLSCLVMALALFVNNGYSQGQFNIIAYGAKGDGKTLNTKVIQQAIDAAAKNGIGKVIVPAGYFLTGPLQLQSGVELYLADGAVLLGSTRRLDYGADTAKPLIGAVRANHIMISGKGTINGQGRELVKNLIQQLRTGKLQDKEWKIKRPTEKNRPRILVFNQCENITVKGITIKNGSGWIQDYVHCNKVVIDSISVISTEYWNNDGIDIVNSHHVSITNCNIDVADDAICLKSEGKPGWCEDVYVADCTLRSSASGFKLGTGSYGGFRKIRVRNLQVFDTYRSAIALEAVDGGFIEDVDIQDVIAKNTGNAIFIRLGHRNKSDSFSSIKNIHINGVKAFIPAGKPDIGYPVEGPVLKYPHNVFPASVTGIPGHPVQEITLENIDIQYEGGAQKEVAYFNADSLERVPENEAGYPEFSMFGELPAWGLYVRHAEGMVLKNIKLSYQSEDFRTPLIFSDVKGLQLSNISIPTAKEAPVLILNKVTQPFLEKVSLPFDQPKAIRIQ